LQEEQWERHSRLLQKCARSKATSRREKQKKWPLPQHAEMKANVEFTVNGKPIEIVEEFEYLGKIVAKC
jgi:hypothetical protein